jgi:hypothetical protein
MVNGNGTASTTVYLQSDCRPVEKWRQEAIKKCAAGVLKTSLEFNTYTSPISLLWGKNVKIKDVVSRSKFPLNPKEAGKWFIWRGSGKTPLVVWDPEGKGIILGANQLFGNYTFDKEWKNGYEALASLDKDNNKWLEGDELKNLALWFDFNQDGNSDTGEVRKLSDVGVTALGTQISQHDTKNGHIFADQGFKRTVGTQVIEGRSVDWFSSSVEGQFGLEALYGGVDEKPDAKSPNLVQAAADGSQEISGFWDWRMVDLSGEELPENMPYGSLTLIVSDKGVSGTSYVPQQLAPNKSGMGEKLIVSSIKGELSNFHGKNKGVTFSTVTPDGGKVESKAVLSSDGAQLYGETVEEFGPNRDKITYVWLARRSDDASR